MLGVAVAKPDTDGPIAAQADEDLEVWIYGHALNEVLVLSECLDQEAWLCEV